MEAVSPFAHSPIAWIYFNVVVLVCLSIDLGVLQKHFDTPTYRQALAWSAVWVGLAVAFGVWLSVTRGFELGVLFFTGYAIEKSLSFDNIMVFAVIFRALAVPTRYQRRVLFWGILGALVMRAGMILMGAALLERFTVVTYILGAIVLLTGVKMLFTSHNEHNIRQGAMWRFIQRVFPLSTQVDGHHFITRSPGAGKVLFTPLMAALMMIEFSDVMFAIDSIPAIFAITKDPFIVYTSNVFAILGLRSLYFLLASAMDQFRFLKTGLALVLCLVGFKMIGLIHMRPLTSLCIVLATLLASIVLSWRITPKGS
jgi:tellurite resistance protein TerC